MADKNILMTHLVAGYPTMEQSRQVALAMVEGGASYLEVQFPFSDPIADGPLIQGACTKALEAGFTVDKGFQFIRELVQNVSVPVFLMTYGNLVIAQGVERFIDRAIEAGASGLIIPDLPFDYDEGLYEKGREKSIDVVPVIIPGIDEERLEEILTMKPAFMYTAIRKGITGQKSTIDGEILSFLDKLDKAGSKVLAGFGIREKEQVDLLAPHVHGSVVGSALVKLVGESIDNKKDLVAEISQYVSTLL